ncbi:MAG TPA: hypothetical protein VE664_06185, partial [Actinomycetes bacterium]|nr:hypothetical protein [Actinomycetes bacterium]
RLEQHRVHGGLRGHAGGRRLRHLCPADLRAVRLSTLVGAATTALAAAGALARGTVAGSAKGPAAGAIGPRGARGRP